MTDLRAYARAAATRAGCDPDLFERQIQQESGFDPDAYNQGSGATGIAQIVSRFHPDVDPRDPIASLDYAARWMATLHRQYGSYQRALAAYNWGPGNVAHWNGQRDSLPAETRHYLDVIMGPAWTEPADAPATGPHEGSDAPPYESVLGFRVARVEPDQLNLRAGPSRAAAVIDRLAEGTLVEPLGPAQVADDLTWLLARSPGGTEGWAAISFLDAVAMPRRQTAPTTPTAPPSEPVKPPRPPKITYRVNTDGVRLRERPATGPDVQILAILDGGTLVVERDDDSGLDQDGDRTVTADGYTWRHVRVAGRGKKRVGWIAAPFISPVTDRRFRFDPSTPTELQAQDWTCSIRSTMWLLKSIGIQVTPAEAQDRMSPAYVNSDVGLLDASGAGIVEVLRDGWDVTAFNRAPVSFDDVAKWAGHCPVAIGGRNWGHWSAVRGCTGDGTPDGTLLVMANPAGTGPRYGQQTLSRQQFEDLGWFSAVVIPVE
jgi:hypothetical protein